MLMAIFIAQAMSPPDFQPAYGFILLQHLMGKV
jgi:hypothetical protein